MHAPVSSSGSAYTLHVTFPASYQISDINICTELQRSTCTERHADIISGTGTTVSCRIRNAEADARAITARTRSLRLDLRTK